MKKQLYRTSERERSARFLNSLSNDELWARFGISRVCDISGFDSLGVPVWSATRPLSKAISINSGKGISTMLARAGAIAEAIEFSVAEVPKPVQTRRTISQMSQWRDFQVVPPERWHLAKGATVNNLSQFDWDVVAPIQNLDALNYLIPSEAIYIAGLTALHLMRFQASTNGWASGASRDDAVLQALYEVVERDSWTIWHTLAETQGRWPLRIDLESLVDWDWLRELLNRFTEQVMRVILFDISTDTILPVIWAVLYDLTDRPAGIFSGFGCAWTKTAAITRALTEAIQSRACYIAGARDDMLRRSFLLMKGVDQQSSYRQMTSLPLGERIVFAPEPSLTAEKELAMALQVLASTGFTEFYVRDLGNPFVGNSFNVAKVVAPCLEQYKCGYYSSTPRLRNYIDGYAR